MFLKLLAKVKDLILQNQLLKMLKNKYNNLQHLIEQLVNN
jgi:hypothetical protein